MSGRRNYTLLTILTVHTLVMAAIFVGSIALVAWIT